MQVACLIASILAAATGVAHFALGEILIFRRVRDGGWVPTLAAPPLQARHIRILWATWHLASVFGWVFTGLLFELALGRPLSARGVAAAVVVAYLPGSLLVLVATRGRHPGWLHSRRSRC